MRSERETGGVPLAENKKQIFNECHINVPLSLFLTATEARERRVSLVALFLFAFRVSTYSH